MDYTKSYRSHFSYEILVPPAELPIRLEDVKTHLRLDPLDTSQDAYLELLIRAASDYCEKYTKRTLINTTFRTYRDFLFPTIELRRSPFSSLVAFEYSLDGTYTAIDTDLYYTTTELDFSKIILKNDEDYPEDGDEIFQMVRIDFVAGYGADYTAIPTDLYIAILNHIAALYENRGDCDLAFKINSNLPNTSRIIYDQYRILEIV